MSQWMPIETAPDDGTAILLFDGHCFRGVCIALLKDSRIWYCQRGMRTPSAREVDGWSDTPFTHWMPLPPLPDEAAT